MDSCIWEPTGVVLRSAGHDVECVGNWPADPGDLEILERAHADGRVLVTADNDFGELAVRQGIPHSGIILLAMTPVYLEAEVCLAVDRHVRAGIDRWWDRHGDSSADAASTSTPD